MSTDDSRPLDASPSTQPDAPASRLASESENPERVQDQENDAGSAVPRGGSAPDASTIMPPSQPGAGWYSNGDELRWWDGQAWGPTAPRQTDPNDGSLATLAHLGFIAGGFVLPLGLYAWADDDRRPATRHHAREALNFQLTLITVQIAVVLLAILGIFGAAWLGPAADAGDADLAFTASLGVVVLLLAVVFVLAIGSMVFSIVAAIRARRGERYRYPLCIRFVGS